MAYSWDMVVSRIAEPLAPEVTKNLVVVSNGNNQFNKNFIGGNGVTMDVSVPDVGTVTAGAALNTATTGNLAQKQSLTLVQYNTGVQLTALSSALDVKNERDQLIIPRSQNIARYNQVLACEEIAKKAANTVVLTADKEYNGLGSAVTNIMANEISGEFHGALNPNMMPAIYGTGVKAFLPDSINAELYKEFSLGFFGMAKWYNTPHIVNFTQSLPTLGSGTTLKAAGTAVNGVISQIVFTVSGGTATLVGDMIAGTPFTVAGINNTTIYGTDTGTLHTMYVATTATAGSNTVTVDLTYPLYLTGPLKNVNISSSFTATTASFVLEAASYRRGIVWTKSQFAVGEATVADYEGFSNADIKDIKGINLKFSRGSSLVDGQNILRIETLMGFKLLRDLSATTIFQKVV